MVKNPLKKKIDDPDHLRRGLRCCGDPPCAKVEMCCRLQVTGLEGGKEGRTNRPVFYALTKVGEDNNYQILKHANVM